jgi:hypothetical protein
VLTATRPDRKVAQILSACTAVVLVFVGINLFHTFGPIHEHNDGPLSVGAAGMALAPSDSGAWTIGDDLCVEQGTDPVILESFSLVAGGGQTPAVLGAFVREIPHAAGGGIGSEQGFPPAVSERLYPVDGYQVTQQCNFNQPTPAMPPPSIELDVGIARPPAFTGGGWTGITVSYRVGSTQYVATFDAPLYLCGPTAPATSACNPPTP